jgi:hypothetical protein
VQVVIDATGLKVYGAGEWLVETHGERDRRVWRKLHLAVDPGSGEVLACELTSTEAGDAPQVAPLLGQISGALGTVIADGTYDGEPVCRAVAVVIPPRATAVPSAAADTAPGQRDRHLQLIRLVLAGPDLATWRELFDFIVEELAAREPEDARRIRPVRVTRQN